MLELGQRLRLAEQLGGDLQRHGAIGQVALPRQVDAAERPPAQLADQPESGEVRPRLRE
jgi:hypothetical protein